MDSAQKKALGERDKELSKKACRTGKQGTMLADLWSQPGDQLPSLYPCRALELLCSNTALSTFTKSEVMFVGTTVFN